MVNMQFETPYYPPKKISEIDLKKDKKVSLRGKIKEVRNNGFRLMDESGEIEVEFVGDVKEGSLIRIFCSILDDRLMVDVIQELKNFDLELARRVEILWKRARID